MVKIKQRHEFYLHKLKLQVFKFKNGIYLV